MRDISDGNPAEIKKNPEGILLRINFCKINELLKESSETYLGKLKNPLQVFEEEYLDIFLENR